MMRTKLTELCYIQYGYAFDSKKFTEDSNCIPLVRIRDVKRGFSETYYSGEYPKEYIVQKNDLLVGMDGEFNIARWQSQDALLNQRVCRVIAKQGVCEDYLRFALTVELKIIENRTAFVTVKHLSAKELNKIELDIPEYGVQERIAKTLIIIEQVLCSRKQQLQQLDELVKARFAELFGNPVKNDMGWKCKPLNDVCDGIGDGLHGTPEYDDNGGYPFINGNNLIDGEIVITSATKMVSEETYKKHIIDISPNAILISINGTLGKLAFYNGEKVMLGKSACYCNLKTNINKFFVYGVMKSDSFAEFLDNSSTKSTIKNVGLKAMREYKLILPPTELQEQFATFVKQVDKSKVVVQKALDEAQTLFDSLMQEYFG